MGERNRRLIDAIINPHISDAWIKRQFWLDDKRRAVFLERHRKQSTFRKIKRMSK